MSPSAPDVEKPALTPHDLHCLYEAVVRWVASQRATRKEPAA